MSMRYPGGFIASTPVTANYPSGVWTQAQAAPYQAQNVWTRDQFWPYTTLLLQGDGAVNGAQNNTFLDSSSNNFTITRNGNTTQGSFTPYEANGYWSNYFKSGDYLGFNSNSAFNMNTYCCLEAWVCYTSLSSSTLVVGRDSSYWIGYDFAGIGGAASKFVFSIYNTGASWQAVSSTTSPVVGVWYHVVGIKDNTTLRIYINGVQENTATFSGTAVTTSNVVQIAANQGTQPMVGYISNTRLVLGASASVLPYTGNFTPPTAPLTAVSGTAFLTCQSNRFVDNSSNAFSVIVNNTPSVQAFQPFPGATTWSASVLGGSGYFDGSGDYLSVTNSNDFDTNTSFTLECWIYTNSNGCMFGRGGGSASWSTTDGHQFIFYINSGVLRWQFNNSGSPVNLDSSAIPLNSWVHCAVGYNGTTTRLWLNGVSAATSTLSYTMPTTRNIVRSGLSASGDLPYTGYISGLRFVKSDVYGVGNTTITIPTAPLTNIANTSLLLSFTNAGIYDNSMMNNLETVGNAQVSTSVVKYGTGSMAFDGSGDYLFVPSRATTSLEGDFTIELWAYRNATNNFRAWCIGDSFTASGIELYVSGSNPGNWTVWGNNASQIVAATATRGVWTHLALVRSGSIISMYVDGVQRGATWTYSSTFSGNVYVAAELYNGTLTSDTNGFLDDFRITKAARYITNFTPPPARMPGQ